MMKKVSDARSAGLAIAAPVAEITCRRCGRSFSASRFALLPSGNRRRVCNSCRWKFTIRASRMKHILLTEERERMRQPMSDYEEMF